MRYLRGNAPLGLLVTLYIFGAWLTHIVVCLQTAKPVFLVLGALLVPIGVVHGTVRWFTFWW
jgi:hypothetical protein